MTDSLHLVLLAISWVLYAIIHSLLAAASVKQAAQRRFPDYYRGYRLFYNGLAGLLLIPPLWLLASYPGDPLWRWPVPLNWLADAAALLAVAGYGWTLRYYDTGEFLGTHQLRHAPAIPEKSTPLTLSPLHRWVRHPWYFLGLVIIWSREMNAALLMTAVMVTLYLVIGSRLEDGKLIATYGDTYRHYRDRVPGLLPLPWRHLSPREAANLLREGDDGYRT